MVKRLLIGVVALALAVPAVAWAGEYEARFTIEPLDAYGTPCGGDVEPWDSYCDMEIVMLGDYKTPTVDLDLSPITIRIEGERIRTGRFLTQMGAELWFHPDRIHRAYGPGSVGVLILWGQQDDDESFAFTIRGKVDGRDPQPVKVGEEEPEPGSDVDEGEMVDQFETETYIPAQPDAKKIKWDGSDFVEAECPTGTFGVPVLEIPEGEWWPVGENGQWVEITENNPHTVYTCSF